MRNNIIKAFLIITLISPACFAQPDFSVFNDIVSAFSDKTDSQIPSVKIAEDKFKNVNINASRDDFLKIITDKNISNLELLKMKERMYELGFFNLAIEVESKINDNNFRFYEKTIDDFYKPSYMLTLEEELFLAEIYSNIFYNDRSVDAIKELSEKRELLKKSDYANYLMALGYYKTNNYKKGIKSINEAIHINSKCENYKFLKIKLLAETGNRKEAIRLTNLYSNKKELPYLYRKKCELIKQFVLYKTDKKEWGKNYALGRYYYTEGNYQKALKSLQNATLTKNKKNLTKVWAMLSRTYLKLDEPKKAKEYALKAYKNDEYNKDANVTLARLYFLEDNYKKSSEHFKKSVKDDKLDTSIIKVAQFYQINGYDEKAKKIYKHLTKKSNDEWESFYNLALMDETKREEYLLKSISSNPMYANSWVELIKIEIDKKNDEKALEYLNNLLYIDENDFRYYYYQGVINRKAGKNTKAVKYFTKCIDLNPEFYDAQKELIELREYI